jgi:hypothetical protein
MTPASSGRLEVGEVSAVVASAIHPRFHAQRMDLFGGLVDIIDHEADVEDPPPMRCKNAHCGEPPPQGWHSCSRTPVASVYRYLIFKQSFVIGNLDVGEVPERWE